MPARLFDDVVVTAEGSTVGDCRRPAIGMVDDVVDVRLRCWHATSWKGTGWAEYLDDAALFHRQTAFPCDTDSDRSSVVVGYTEPVFGVGLLFDRLSSDVGDDRPVATEVSRVVVELRKRFEIDPNIDGALSRGGTAFEVVPATLVLRPVRRSSRTSARSWSMVRVSPLRRSVFAMALMRRVASWS